jgi:trans-2,3-dihydro-3-hydroxyanthranilate isomerase
MRRYPYLQLDVFTAKPFRGNQLAVVFDADTLDVSEMQAIAREMNFSESTFVLAPKDPNALCRVRIFTPGGELPFAGHPVIGTAVAVVYEMLVNPGDETPWTFELGVGPITITPNWRNGALTGVWMNQPVPTFTPWGGDRAALMDALGLDEAALRPDLPITVGSAGVPHILVPLRDRAALAQARHGAGLAAALARDDLHTGVYLYTTPASSSGDKTVYARMFAPGMGIAEDAATGSAAGPLGAFLALCGVAAVGADGRSETQVIQGVEMGRRSEMSVEARVESGAVTGVRVGGMAYVIAKGEFILFDAVSKGGEETAK